MSSSVSVRASWPRPLVAWLCSLLLLLPLVRSGPVNITIDDSKGDASTGAMPIYQPAGQWSFGPTCTDCLIKADASKAIDGSWHDTSLFPQQQATSVTLSFNGTAIYVFCILADTIPGATTTTDLAFTLDGSSAGVFKHVPSTSTDIQYNQMVFAQDGLKSGPHTLVIALQAPSVMLFDYALYTFGEPQLPAPVSSTAPASSTSEVIVTLPPSTSTTFSTVVVTPTASSVSSAQASVTSNSFLESSDSLNDDTSTSSPPESSTVSHIAGAIFPTGSSLVSMAPTEIAATSSAAETISSSSSTPASSSGIHIPMIAFIGAGVGALVLVALAVLLCISRRRKSRYQDLDNHSLDRQVVEEFAPCYMPPISVARHSSVSSIHGFSSASNAALLECVSTPLSSGTPRSSPSLVPVSSYTHGQITYAPSVTSTQDQGSIQALQQPLHEANRTTDRFILPPPGGNTEVNTLASGFVSVTTMEETAMRERVDVLQNQVERMVSAQEPTWEDLPPAYDSPSTQRVLPKPPGSMPADEKRRF